MEKKVKKRAPNYLDYIPVRKQGLAWQVEESGRITLLVENKGVFNRIAQKLLKKPKVTQVHLDEMGSFVWPLVDGKKSIIVLAQEVDAHFGEAAAPLYERLAKFFHVLASYQFVSMEKE